MAERKGINHTDLKNRNRGLVLQQIACQETPTRTQIARDIGLTKMAVTNIVTEWMRAGWVEETQSAPSLSAGRNPVVLAVAPGAPLAIGLYLSRTCAAMLVADLRLHVLWLKRRVLQEETRDSLTDKLVELLREAMAWRESNRPEATVCGLGISAIGTLDVSGGQLLSPTDFFGIQDYPIASRLQEACNLPVWLHNDMKAAALAEKLYGAGRPLQNFLYVGITAGVGAGIVSDGRLYQEASGLVGEIGHMSIDYRGPICRCGARGCLETYISIPVLLERLRAATGRDWAPTALADAVRHPAAWAVLQDAADILAVALTNAVNLFNPACIFLGHEGAFLPDDWLQRIEDTMNHYILASAYRHVPVRRSYFGSTAPLLGSACVVWQELFAGRLIPAWPD